MIPRMRHVALVPTLLACLLAITTWLAILHSSPRAQTADEPVFGVTAFDVAPAAGAQGVALLKQYREGALKQAGATGILMLQETGWPNRFIIYEGWKDQAAYDANDKAAHSAALRDQLAVMGAAPYDRREHRAISVAPASAAPADAIYMHLHLDVFPAGLEPTLAAARAVAEAARKADGNLRYDAVKSIKQPVSHSTLIGVWPNRKAFEAYENSAYARQFRETVGPLLGSPFDDRLYSSIN